MLLDIAERIFDLIHLLFFLADLTFSTDILIPYLSLPTLILSYLHSHSGRVHSKITRYNIFLQTVFGFTCVHAYVTWFKYQMFCVILNLGTGRGLDIEAMETYIK
jgi:hypothetical protein